MRGRTLNRSRLGIGLLLVLTGSALAQDVALDRCLGDGEFCSETVDAVVDSSCGDVYYAYRGRLSWEPLRNAGPVTIAVRTHRKNFRVAFPLYVELVAFVDTVACSTDRPAISVVLVAHGTHQCEGIWESVGPIDLTEHSIPLGALYRVQLEFFASLPDVHEVNRTSVGVSCVRVTPATSAVRAATWGAVKAMYRQ
jgi:hypothetical protein